MPRYYCDYCDTYLTHDSPSVRKQHNAGYKHKANVRSYYQQFEEQQTQSLIDQKIKEHLGQTTAYQVGANFHQHLSSLPPNIRGPRLPVLPIGSQPPINLTFGPGIRPPVIFQPPTGTPGYVPGLTSPAMVSPPGASPMQANELTRPPTLIHQEALQHPLLVLQGYSKSILVLLQEVSLLDLQLDLHKIVLCIVKRLKPISSWTFIEAFFFSISFFFKLKSI